MECLNYLEPQMTDFAGTIFSGQLAAKRAEAIRSRELIETELACINATLAKSLFLIDDRLTAADIVVYPVIQLLLRAANKPASETIAGSLVAVEQVYPALLAWFRRIEAIPGYQRTYPPHWR
jgi:glutathione S-transferase